MPPAPSTSLAAVGALLGLAALGVARLGWAEVVEPPDALAPLWQTGQDATTALGGEGQGLLVRAWARAGRLPGPGSEPLDARLATPDLMPPAVAAELADTLQVMPELVGVLLVDSLAEAVGAACPAVPEHLAPRCDPRRWTELRQELPGGLAQLIARGSDEARAEALEVSCAHPPRAAAVQKALSTQSFEPGPAGTLSGWPATAPALLASCGAEPGPASASDRAWGVALAQTRAGSPSEAGRSSAPTLAQVMARYGDQLRARGAR